MRIYNSAKIAFNSSFSPCIFRECTVPTCVLLLGTKVTTRYPNRFIVIFGESSNSEKRDMRGMSQLTVKIQELEKPVRRSRKGLKRATQITP